VNARGLSRVALALLVESGLLGVNACFRGRQTPDLMDEVIVERIIHGTVAVTGTRDDLREVLQTGNGPLRLWPSRQDSIALMRLERMEIAARGVEENGGLRLERFTVTNTTDGTPVMDGMVGRDSTGYYLEMPKRKRLPITNAPDVFKALVGARIWMYGPSAAGSYQYGVIVP
jgi:hypothetical protein